MLSKRRKESIFSGMTSTFVESKQYPKQTQILKLSGTPSTVLGSRHVTHVGLENPDLPVLSKESYRKKHFGTPELTCRPISAKKRSKPAPDNVHVHTYS
jgi:hypothetical protein